MVHSLSTHTQVKTVLSDPKTWLLSDKNVEDMGEFVNFKFAQKT